ncbi:MAG TPA: HAD family phosphatase [Acidimicrobiia bacterium]|nr:HAD family phosphatase [Acidimicrobiia bacterium]
MQGTGTVELVIFDYGGVISERLVDDVADFEVGMGYPTGSLNRLLFGEIPEGSDGDPVDGAYDEGPVHDFHLLEMGKLGFDEYLEGLTRRAPEILGTELTPDAFIEFSAAYAVRVQWPIVHEIRRLDELGVPLALLTNNVKEFGDSWRASFPVAELFPLVVDSSEVGMRKPDPRIYELTCSRAGAEPAASIFLDDHPDNVTAARALGIETVHVGHDPLAVIDELRSILERRGVRTR